MDKHEFEVKRQKYTMEALEMFERMGWISLAHHEGKDLKSALGFDKKGDYPELTDQLLEAEAEARKEVKND